MTLSLLSWSKQEGIAYSTAQKMYNDGAITGAFRNENGTRIKVPEGFTLTRETVTCQVCSRSFPQITGTHLKLHDMSFDEYKTRFPDAPTVSSEVSCLISGALSGRTLSDETKAKISDSKSGTQAWNKGLTGIYTASEKTRSKMSAAHSGVLHTEDAKAKIGNAHRGKIISPEAIERSRQGLLEYYSHNAGVWAGKKRSQEDRDTISKKMKEVFANMTPERIAELAEQRAQKIRGLKRTDEQKETYRAARCKWMSKNPLKTVNTTGERTVAAWLDGLGVEYRRQYLVEGLHHPFDFYVPEFHLLIEFDGAHHWLRPWFNVLGKDDQERAGMLEAQKAKDVFQTAYARQKGYKVIRFMGKADVGDCKEWGSLQEQLANQSDQLDHKFLW